ncbi:MAG: M20 family metallopeptidase [Acidobacteria bacterium]|nr:M20 family metallopeptidase [Acidobacteriota bacterium]
MTDLKTRLADHVRTDARTLIDLSHRIHAHPELGFEEVRASAWVADTLAAAGLAVTRPACDLPTAFTATIGSGALHVGICAEYDALPGIGHACGHNIIAASAVGAARALAPLVDTLGITLTVFGTPAEEVGDAGGKILMIERGAFDGVHVAMMIHPGPYDVVTPNLIASSTFDVHYAGKAAHASAFPELGVNAGDALTIAQTAIGLLRQHIRPTDRVHGIVTNGGDAPNIVPAHTAGRFTVRAANLEDLQQLQPRIHRCFEAGAIATGASLRTEGGAAPYAEVVHDLELAAFYRRNAEALGRQFMDSGPFVERAAASTDMGNVSRRIPSIHPMIGIDSFPAVNHQPDFAAHCITAAADQALIDGAIAMAWTVVDLATNAATRQRLFG